MPSVHGRANVSKTERPPVPVHSKVTAGTVPAQTLAVAGAPGTLLKSRPFAALAKSANLTQATAEPMQHHHDSNKALLASQDGSENDVAASQESMSCVTGNSQPFSKLAPRQLGFDTSPAYQGKAAAPAAPMPNRPSQVQTSRLHDRLLQLVSVALCGMRLGKLTVFCTVS